MGLSLYRTLYTARQQQGAYLPRQWYYDDALALPWVRSIDIKISTALNKQSARGLVYSSNRQTHGGMESFDYTIIIADGLTTESERFVTIKELMHCYFAPVEKNVKYLTGSQVALESHMNAFFGNSTEDNSASRAETMALWMALGVICTEHDRKAMVGTMSPQAIGQKAVIPLKQAKNLVSNVYLREIAKLVS